MTDTIESLRQQLAECQATNGMLREALDGALSQMTSIANGNSQYVEDLKSAVEALALPNDATALNELIEERTASLTAEVERLKNEHQEFIARLQNENCGRVFMGEPVIEERPVPAKMYLSAVNGRREFRSQVVELRKQNAELTAQRDALLAFAAAYISAWNNGAPGDSDIFFMAESAIANCKEQK